MNNRNIKYVFYSFGYVVLIDHMMISAPNTDFRQLLSGRWFGSCIPHDNAFRGIPYTHNLKHYYIIKNGIDKLSKM